MPLLSSHRTLRSDASDQIITSHSMIHGAGGYRRTPGSETTMDDTPDPLSDDELSQVSQGEILKEVTAPTLTRLS